MNYVILILSGSAQTMPPAQYLKRCGADHNSAAPFDGRHVVCHTNRGIPHAFLFFREERASLGHQGGEKINWLHPHPRTNVHLPIKNIGQTGLIMDITSSNCWYQIKDAEQRKQDKPFRNHLFVQASWPKRSLAKKNHNETSLNPQCAMEIQ